MNAETSTVVPIVMIEDNRFIRNGMKLVLQNEPGFELIGSYPNCEEAFSGNDIGSAKLVLMDLKLPGMSGIEGVRFLKKNYPDILVLVCTAYEDDKNIFNAILAGATGFLEKKTPSQELLKILRVVIEGGSPITPVVAQKILSVFNKYSINPGRATINLTENELDILGRLAVGKSYYTVAKEIGLTNEKVLKYVRRVYEKIHHSYK